VRTKRRGSYVKEIFNPGATFHQDGGRATTTISRMRFTGLSRSYRNVIYKKIIGVGATVRTGIIKSNYKLQVEAYSMRKRQKHNRKSDLNITREEYGGTRRGREGRTTLNYVD